MADVWEASHAALYDSSSSFSVPFEVNSCDQADAGLGKHRHQKHSSWSAEIESPWLADSDEFAKVADVWEAGVRFE